MTNSIVERKCSGGSDPGSTTASSSSTIPISQFHHHNIYSGTSPVEDMIDPLQNKDINPYTKMGPQHNRFFCNHSGCNSNGNALPERHVSGGFTAPPLRQTSDPSGTSSASTTTATTPSSGSVQAPDTPSVSAISTPSSGTGTAQAYAMTSTGQTATSANTPHQDLPCNLFKVAAVSDELLLQQQQQQRLQLSVTFADNVSKSPEHSNAEDVAENSTSGGSTTATSFDLLNGNNRARHSSDFGAVRSPTTANTHVSAERARQLALQHHASLMGANGQQHTIHGTGMSNGSSRVQIDGSKLSLRLTKSQIDNAAKSKRKMYQDNFSITLFLIKPTDQSENLKDYTLPLEMITSRNAGGQHDTYKNSLNTHTPLGNSSSEGSVAMSTGVMGECTMSSNTQYSHLQQRSANSKNLLKFNVSGKGQKPGNSNVQKTRFETNSSPESSSEDDLASIEMASGLGMATNERKGILRKNNSNCSSARIIAASTKTKASGLVIDSTPQALSTVSSHQLMTSASEVMHSKTNTGLRNECHCHYPTKGGEANKDSSDSADILRMRRLSSDTKAPPTDNMDTSITTCTTTLASGTSDFVVVSLSDCTGSAVSHVNHVNNANVDSLREPSDHKSTVTATPSTSTLHHHSHHPMLTEPVSASTLITHQSTWI